MAEMKSLRKRYKKNRCQARGEGWWRPLHFLHRPSPTPLPANPISGHVAHNLKLLFLENNNGANTFSVKFNFRFVQKSDAVLWR